MGNHLDSARSNPRGPNSTLTGGSATPELQDLSVLARRLITEHPDYFLPDRSSWRARVGSALCEQVHAHDQTLFDAWLTRTTATIARLSEPLERARACARVAARLLVNQRTVHVHLTEEIRDRDFFLSNFSRLLRGFVNCEGQNQLLLQLLRQFFAHIELFETGDGTHVLVRVETPDGWFFADAWAEHSIFYVASLSGRPLPGVPEYDSLPISGPLREHGLLPKWAYEQGVSPVWAPRSSAVAIAGSGAPAPVMPAWQAYLTLRCEQLADPSADIRAGYQRLLSEHRFAGVTRAVVETLAARASSGR